MIKLIICLTAVLIGGLVWALYEMEQVIRSQKRLLERMKPLLPR